MVLYLWIQFYNAVCKVLLTFRGAIIAKNIQLSEHFADNIPAKVVGDRFRIEHVFSNLLSNAIKFSYDGHSVKVDVSADIDSEANIAIITVTLTDEGFRIMRAICTHNC